MRMSNEKYLTEKVLESLPSGKFVMFNIAIDMSGKNRDCVIWNHRSEATGIQGNSAFDSQTGEYICRLE